MAQTPYYWVPLDDDAYSFYARQRATVTSGYVLPHTDGTYPCDQRNRNWTDLKGYDQINICAHGVATNLSVVGWSTSNGVVKWGADRLAQELELRLSTYGRKNAVYDIHLRAC